jgi:hypothetical protein
MKTRWSDKRRGWFIFVFLLLIIFCAAPAKGAVLLYGCSGSGCNGTNPNTTGCDVGASTVAYVTINYHGNIQLRNSSGCNTYWARTILDLTYIEHYANATLMYYYWKGSTYPIQHDQVMYTLQRYSGSGYQACGYLGDTQQTSYYPSNCTSPVP